MDPDSVKKYIGKRVRIILKNNYNYTAVIPAVSKWRNGKEFSVVDKFGKNADMDCDFIAFITEEEDR